MAMRLSLLCVTNHLMCSPLRPPQPIWTQFSFLPGLSAARMFGPEKKGTAEMEFGPEKKGTAEMVPAARALRLINDRRVSEDFICLNNNKLAGQDHRSNTDDGPGN